MASAAVQEAQQHVREAVSNILESARQLNSHSEECLSLAEVKETWRELNWLVKATSRGAFAMCYFVSNNFVL
jgi:hypothetical protein